MKTTCGYRCSECHAETSRWAGRCPECGAWNSLGPAAGLRTQVRKASRAEPAQPITRIDPLRATARPTGISELDRVLGHGLTPGSVILLAGEPGVGKSTLTLQLAAGVATREHPTLIVSGEESAEQVRLRADRIRATSENLYVAAESDLGAVAEQVEQVQPGLLVVDSVQTMSAPGVDGAVGGVTQVRAVADLLVRLAKARGLTVVLIGHVTKDGQIAGPRVLEHVVDVVLSFEGDRNSRLRLVRGVKNRFGAADEIGCFQIGEGGLRELADPSGLFRSGATEPVPGTANTVVCEGRRALIAELQALVTGPVAAGVPRRASSGIDSSRLAMTLAVLEKRAGLRLADRDVYVASVGGARITDPAADLSVALAIAGSAIDQPVPRATVALGEVGLAGEIRPIRGLEPRLAEAARLGYTTALVPAGSPLPAGCPLRIIEVCDLLTALWEVQLTKPLAA